MPLTLHLTFKAVALSFMDIEDGLELRFVVARFSIGQDVPSAVRSKHLSSIFWSSLCDRGRSPPETGWAHRQEPFNASGAPKR